MGELLNEMMKTAVVINPERTRAIQSNPAMSEVLKKIRDADTTRTSAKAVYDSKTPAIKALGKRVDKNNKRLDPYLELTDVKDLMVQPEGAKLRSFMDDRNLSRETVNAQRDEARKWAKFYEKKYRKNPDALKNAPHDLKYYKKSKDLYQRAFNDRDPYTQSFYAADSAKKEGIKEYKSLRRPLPPEPPVDKSKPKFKFSAKQEAELQALRDEMAKKNQNMNDRLKGIFSDAVNEAASARDTVVNNSESYSTKNSKQSLSAESVQTPTPPSRNRYLKPLAIGAGAAATIGGGAYLYNRYQKKKREQAEQEKTATSWDEVDQSADQVRRAGKSLSKTKNQVFNNIQDRHEVFNEYMADALNRIHSNSGAMSSSLDGDNNGPKHGSGYNKLKAASERAKTNRKFQDIDDMLDALRDKPVKQKEKPRFQTKSGNRYRVLDRSTESLDDMMSRVSKQSERRFGDSAFVDVPYTEVTKNNIHDSGDPKKMSADAPFTEVIKNKSHGSGDPKHLDVDAAAPKMVNEGKEKLPKNHNQRNKMIGLGVAGIGAAAGGAYLYNRYKKKKQEEAEKTAGLLDDLVKTKKPLGLATKKRAMNPLREAARKAQFEAFSNMRVNSLGKKAFLDFAEMEKIALMNKIPTTYSQKPIGANPSLPPPKSLLGKANQAPYEPLKPIQATKNTINNSEYMDRFRELSGGRSPGQAVNGAYTKLKNKLTTPTPSVPTPSVPTPKVEQATEAAKALGKSGKSFKFKAGAGLGIAALGTGAYLYGRNQEKKKQNEMGKYSALESEDFEKTAVTKEEKEQLRRMTGMAKRKVKKKKPNKTKESMYRMKKQKKHAAYDDAELEKMASLMADQFIAASALTSVNPEAMDFETELIAGYKSYIDEVNS